MCDPAKICYNCMGELQQMGDTCPRCGWDNTTRECGPGYLSSCVLNNQYFVGRALERGGFGITYPGRFMEGGKLRRLSTQENCR